MKKPNFKQLHDSAQSIISSHAYNYNYVYYMKTPNGMVLDIPSIHKYGDDRNGYEQWKAENRELDASYSGVTSVRTITNREHNITGYIFETKKTDKSWHIELETRYNEIFEELCIFLEVVDKSSFKYYIESELPLSKDYGSSIMNRLNHLIDVCDRYDYDEDFKVLLDKIKG